MNSRNAWFWAFAAAVLFLALVTYQHFFHRPAPGPELLLPGFNPAAVSSLQLIPAGAEEIQVQRTNGNWRLTTPMAYPAQSNSIEALLQALGKVIPATKISGAQLRKTEGERAAFGLETPRASLVLSNEAGRQQLLFGALTAPGDQAFVQIVGREGIYVVDAELLKLVPHSATQWRDTGFCALPAGGYDGIVVSSPDGVLELRREATNRTWRIVRPMQARADNAHVQQLVQSLRDLRVQQFVSDDPRADRLEWGLQPVQFQIVFNDGSNTVQTLQFGTPVEGANDLVYAVGREPGNVVMVASEPLQAWRATPNAFRDRQILNLSGEIASIEIGTGTNFTLVNPTNGSWRVDPQGFPADPVILRQFVEAMQNLQVAQFVKDVVAEPDLPEYGLATPRFRVSFSLKPGSDGKPRAPITLDFGAAKEDRVFVRRSDENAVYAVEARLLETIPAAAGHFRQRDLWSFTEDQVASVKLQKAEAAWQVERNGLNQWSLASGSQGIVNAFAVEEAVHRLGQLSAVVWTDWGVTDPTPYGLGTDALTLTAELKDGSRKTVQFGFPSPSGHVYAGLVFNGETWVFEFPSDTFDLLETCLIKPSNLR